MTIKKREYGTIIKKRNIYNNFHKLLIKKNYNR